MQARGTIALSDTFSIDAIAIPELGNTTYLVVSGGEAAVIDAPRAVDQLLDAAAARGVRITHVFDTHVHNDFISGACELRERAGARIVAPRRGRFEFPHLSVAEGDEIRFGDVRITAIETPGHTPEHIAYLVHAANGHEPDAAFTGGSLLVGNAGRSDLLGPDLTDRLNGEQFSSIRRLARLPGSVRVLPTHGAGSFCVPIGGSSWERTSTVESERRQNPLLAMTDVEEFLAMRTEGLLPIPAYYPHVAPINRRGASGLPPLRPSAISPAYAESLAREGALILDLRDRMAFCGAHVPGSINVELDGAMPGRLGSVVAFGTPLVLVVGSEDDATLDRATTGLARVGFERLLGFLGGGMDAWRSSGRPVEELDAATPLDLWEALNRDEPPLVLDVRMPIEWTEGLAVADALTIHFGDLPARMRKLPTDREIWTLCSAGSRATIAASMLQRAGRTTRPVATGGVLDLLELEAAAGVGPRPLYETH